MKAILIQKPGGPEVMVSGSYPDPVPKKDDLLIQVEAAGVNRADILQRRGKYPPPPGASPLLGLEIAGTVLQAGSGTSGWQSGDRIMALLPGGGYAELAAVPAEMALPIPAGFTFEEAAGVPEAFLTAFQALIKVAALKPGESVLIHAGASGVGSAAIQLAKAFRFEVLATAGSEEKVGFCESLGASLAVNYREKSFADEVLKYTNGSGVNAVIDFVGASYWESNIRALAPDGRLVILGLLGGFRIDSMNLTPLLRKRLSITGSTLRNRPRDYKAILISAFRSQVLPLFEQKKVRPVIDRVFDWNDVGDAHRYMEANKNLGKLILKITDGRRTDRI